MKQIVDKIDEKERKNEKENYKYLMGKYEHKFD
jgi:hypothetical protein